MNDNIIGQHAVLIGVLAGAVGTNPYIDDYPVCTNCDEFCRITKHYERYYIDVVVDALIRTLFGDNFMTREQFWDYLFKFHNAQMLNITNILQRAFEYHTSQKWKHFSGVVMLFLPAYKEKSLKHLFRCLVNENLHMLKLKIYIRGSNHIYNFYENYHLKVSVYESFKITTKDFVAFVKSQKKNDF